MIIKNVNLETVCGITSAIPDNLLDEVAFAGKSNVGKSSLINALMNRKSLARTSSQPGKTQTINFYNVNEAMYLVDLPGYGYANVSLKVKEQWGKMIERYLRERYKIPEDEAEFAAGFSLGNIGKAEAIVSSEEFQDLKELTLSILRYIHEIESYEIADKVKEYKKYKNRIEDFFDIFLMWFRDIMLLKADNSVNAEAAKKKIIFKNEYAYLKKQVDKLDLEAIDYVIGKIHRARVRIKSNVNFDATLELLIVEARREF